MRRPPHPEHLKRALAQRYGKARLDWKYLDPLSQEPRLRPMCNSILREGLHPHRTESTSASFACKPQACDSTGNGPRCSPDKIPFSSRRFLPRPSPPSPLLLLLMPETFGAGRRSSALSIALILRTN